MRENYTIEFKGQTLNQLIKESGMTSLDEYISNVVFQQDINLPEAIIQFVPIALRISLNIYIVDEKDTANVTPNNYVIFNRNSYQ